MNKEIATTKAPGAMGPYSQAVKSGGFIFISGQIPINPETGNIPAGIKAQTEQVLNNIKAILESEKLSMASIADVTVFLADAGDFSEMFVEMNKVYESFFPGKPFPARAAVQVAALPRNVLVEIKVTALV